MAEDIPNNSESNSDQPELPNTAQATFKNRKVVSRAGMAKKRAKAEKSTKASQLASLITGLVTLIVGVLTIVSGGKDITDFASKRISVRYKNILISEDQFEDLKKETEALSRQFDQLRKIDTTSKSESVDYNRLNASVKALSSRIDLIEKAILDSPEKALTIPLMRKDLDNYTLSQTTRINDLAQNLSNSISQVYTVIGSVTVVIGLGFIGFAAASRAAKPDKKE